MKKKLQIVGALALFLSFFSTNQIHAQALEQGNVVISPYYGFPNLYTSVLKSTYANSGYNEEVGGIGPVGLRGEFMATDRIGIGVDFNYANTYIKWSDDFSGPVYNYEVSVPRIRAMARFNFHFGNSDVFDFYAGVGAGFSSFTAKYETDDPDWFYEEVSNPIPVAFRAAVGTTYFFTDFLGASLELGLGGGALMHFGVSLKI